MKKIITSFAALLMGISATAQKDAKSTELKYDSSQMENAIIYEANIRQYSPEGTFNAFTKDIPKLKSVGVKIIW